MPDQDYLPRADLEFLTWHDRLLEAVQVYGAALGLSAAEQTHVKAANQAFHAHLDAVDDATTRARVAVSEKDAFRQKLEVECRALANRVKAHPDYSTAIGTGFGIVSRRAALDPVSLQPVLTLLGLPGHAVRVSYAKNGTNGIHLYSRLVGETEWALLGRSTRSPLVDRRALRQPGLREDREYRAFYMIGDEQVGQASAIATITTRE